MKPPKMLNNQKGNTVYEELDENIEECSKISMITSLFSVYAYYELKEKLDKIDNMRIIFTNPNFVKNNDDAETKEYYINNNLKGDLFGSQYELRLKNELTQCSISRACARWVEEKVEIKSYARQESANPRMLCLENEEDDKTLVINGSVDFNTEGLGITNSNRNDINQCTYGQFMLDSFKTQFDSLWNNGNLVVDVKEEFLNQLKLMYDEKSPEFIYFVSLYYLFNDYLRDLNENTLPKVRTGFKDTEIWKKLYEFQKDAVLGAIGKIDEYHGCILADSVGLGKTFTALAIIKYYELRNDRVLVLVPKKLRDNWTIYTKNDIRNIFSEDRFNFDVLNHTDLSRDHGKSGDIDLNTINWGNYDLVVIDESHNFRNNPAVKDHETRYQKLMNKIIKSGVQTKVLLLSATPVNNRMADIKNQIAFITENNDNALEEVGIKSIEYTLRLAQGTYNQWSKLPSDERTTEAFVDLMNMDYFKLLDTLTIARSRKHILKYYGDNKVGSFPKRLNPINRSPNIDEKDEFPSIEKITNTINKLNLPIYSPLQYIYPNKIGEYDLLFNQQVKDGKGEFKQRDREVNLVNLIRTNLLKRMESSIYSFTITTEKILYKINNFLEMIDKHEIKFQEEYDMEIIDPEEEEYDKFMFGKKNEKEIKLIDMDLVKLKQDLELDKDRLEKIIEISRKITPKRDAKLNNLKQIIQHKIENPINGTNKKIIVFTAFEDTANYLYDNLNEWLFNKYGLYSAKITGSDNNKTNLKNVRSTDMNDILMNFSPQSKERAKITTQTTDIDLLMATDCISEGQNLQDCDYLINYDIHWNPVRIIQRFGRIDRIGSKNKEIQLVNFWPNMEIDEYINLKKRVENRMVMVDVSTTGDENVIQQDSDREENNELEYRKKQLEKLKEEVIDLEDVSGGISITDLTFNDFKIQLQEYMETHEGELEDAPLGIYSIVEIDEELRDTLDEGVIFLLRDIHPTGNDNPLSPYFIVYITKDKVVKLNYGQAKKIMDHYRKLCSGKSEVYVDLVKEFNKETDDGVNMEQYSELLRIAIENLQEKEDEIGVRSLFKKGGTIPTKKHAPGLEEFELITFLILR